jgi:hypothetical protein
LLHFHVHTKRLNALVRPGLSQTQDRAGA